MPEASTYYGYGDDIMKRDFTQTPYDLNCPDPKDRLESLRACMRGVIGGRLSRQKGLTSTNHPHDILIFSLLPYTGCFKAWPDHRLQGSWTTTHLQELVSSLRPDA